MAVQVNDYAISRMQAVKAMMGIRHEWEDHAKGESLLNIEASVGYLLYDIALALNLNQQEIKLALGDLADEADKSVNG